MKKVLVLVLYCLVSVSALADQRVTKEYAVTIEKVYAAALTVANSQDFVLEGSDPQHHILSIHNNPSSIGWNAARTDITVQMTESDSARTRLEIRAVVGRDTALFAKGKHETKSIERFLDRLNKALLETKSK